MSNLLDKFVTEVAARTSDGGEITKNDLRAAFTAATGEAAPRDLHETENAAAEFDALAEEWSARSVPEAAPHPDPHAPEDAAYAAYARQSGIVDAASLRRGS